MKWCGAACVCGEGPTHTPTPHPTPLTPGSNDWPLWAHTNDNDHDDAEDEEVFGDAWGGVGGVWAGEAEQTTQPDGGGEQEDEEDDLEDVVTEGQ